PAPPQQERVSKLRGRTMAQTKPMNPALGTDVTTPDPQARGWTSWLSDDTSTRSAALLVGVLMAMALLLPLPHLAGQSPSLDDIYSMLYARMSWSTSGQGVRAGEG